MDSLRQILSPEFLLRNSVYTSVLIGFACPLVGVFLVLRRLVFMQALWRELQDLQSRDPNGPEWRYACEQYGRWYLAMKNWYKYHGIHDDDLYVQQCLASLCRHEGGI